MIMENIVIFDFEVFYSDVLLGCLIITDKDKKLVQTWDKEQIKQLYNMYYNSIWVGHNNSNYDNRIFEAVLNSENPFMISKKIINKEINGYSNIKLCTYDILNSVLNPWSLKVSEAVIGKSIETSEVDFNLMRSLTEEEKILTEKYNESDLNQTYSNFIKFYEKFKLRLDMIKEFNLDLRTSLLYTDTKLIEKILNVKADPTLVYNPVVRQLPKNIKIDNKDVINWYLNNSSESEGIQVKINDNYYLDVLNGGLHGALKKIYRQKCIEIDVQSLYPSLIIKYNLFPRSMSEESKKVYTDFYYERLRIKKTKPQRQKILKKILNSVYGASNSKYSTFYDPSMEYTIAATGELVMIDLTEKLKPYVEFIQHNTDGIVFIPHDWNETFDKVKEIVKDWETRTELNMEWDELENFWQRDVNNYCCLNKGKEIFKGEAFKTNDIGNDAFVSNSLFNYKEPPIIGRAMLNYFLYNIWPEQTIEKEKHNLLFFAYICKKNTYDKLIYKQTNLKDGSESSYNIQSPSRVFALSDNENAGMVYKYKIGNSKNNYGKEIIAKVSNLPDNVFIYNDEILSEETIDKLSSKINFDYYIKRTYERMIAFIK